MRDLRRRIGTLIARVRAGEGAYVLADLGETAELWLTSGWIPLPARLRGPVERLGEILGDLARARRPAPADVPPPPEEERRSARPPADIPVVTLASEPLPKRPIVPPPVSDTVQVEAPRVVVPPPAAVPESAPRVAVPPPAAVQSVPNEGMRVAASPPKPARKGQPSKETRRKEKNKKKVSEPPERRVSARRPNEKRERTEPPPEDKAKRERGNGKGRERRPAARRTRNGKPEKPT